MSFRYTLVFTSILIVTLISIQTHSASETNKAVFLTYNPHSAMFKESKINANVCLLCHTVKHTSEPKITGKREYLTEDVNVICAGCHGFNPHVGAKAHLVKPKSQVMKKIEVWEKKNSKKLRLDDKGRITCSTCHSPHPSGMLKALSAEAYKDLVDYMGRYSEDKTGTSSLFSENLQRFKRLKIFSPPVSDEINRVRLPFREDMTESKFCMLCHDVYE